MYSWKFSLKHKCFQNPGLRFSFRWMSLQLLRKFKHDCVSKFLETISSSSELRSKMFLRDGGSSFNFLLGFDEMLVRITRFFDLKFIATDDWPRLAMMMLPFWCGSILAEVQLTPVRSSRCYQTIREILKFKCIHNTLKYKICTK